MPDSGRVSVIIPVKNSASTIGKCLDSISSQTYHNIEILVVDGKSTDGTEEICNNLGAKVISVEGERAAAKNQGLKLARGEFVFFVDSDMVLQRNVIEECVGSCGGNVAGVIIPERSIGDRFWVKVRDFERALYLGSRIESARFFKTKVAIAAGGFDEEVVTYEESTLPQKIEKMGFNTTTRVKSALILHDESMFKLKKWLEKKRYYGKSAAMYASKYPDYAQTQLNASRRIKLFLSDGRWKILFRRPMLTSGLVILKTLEYISQRRESQ